MKKVPEQDSNCITGSWIQPLVDQHKATVENRTKPSISNAPLKPAAEYQDDGGGYNSSLVYEQK